MFPEMIQLSSCLIYPARLLLRYSRACVRLFVLDEQRVHPTGDRRIMFEIPAVGTPQR